MPEHRHRRHGSDGGHFDSWSRRYDRSWLQPVLFDPVQKALVAAVAPRAPKDVLDIGCGTGRLLERLGAALPGARMVGIDASAGMLAAAHQRRPGLDLTRGTAEALPYPGRSFDLVTSTLSFHHWSDQATAVSEIHRVLRPGGWFALADATVDDIPGPLRHLVETRASQMLPLAERHRLIEAAGLRVSEVVPALHGHWVALTLAYRHHEK